MSHSEQNVSPSRVILSSATWHKTGTWPNSLQWKRTDSSWY